MSHVTAHCNPADPDVPAIGDDWPPAAR